MPYSQCQCSRDRRLAAHRPRRRLPTLRGLRAQKKCINSSEDEQTYHTFLYFMCSCVCYAFVMLLLCACYELIIKQNIKWREESTPEHRPCASHCLTVPDCARLGPTVSNSAQLCTYFCFIVTMAVGCELWAVWLWAQHRPSRPLVKWMRGQWYSHFWPNKVNQF